MTLETAKKISLELKRRFDALLSFYKLGGFSPERARRAGHTEDCTRLLVEMFKGTEQYVKMFCGYVSAVKKSFFSSSTCTRVHSNMVCYALQRSLQTKKIYTCYQRV